MATWPKGNGVMLFHYSIGTDQLQGFDSASYGTGLCNGCPDNLHRPCISFACPVFTRQLALAVETHCKNIAQIYRKSEVLCPSM